MVKRFGNAKFSKTNLYDLSFMRSAAIFLCLMVLAISADLQAETGKSGNSGVPVKCATPHLLQFERDPERVDPNIRKQIAEADDYESLDDQVHYPESGKFRFVYSTDGSDAVPSDDSNGSGIPDYVEWAAEAADESYRKQIEELGFRDPTIHQGLECGNRIGIWQEEVITVRFRNFNFYGQFHTTRPFEFLVHNNFENFPPNTDPDGNVRGALRATIAHEFKHVIQYATSCFAGDAFSWLEIDATMMEDIVYPEVNDYYNYIEDSYSVFNTPHRSVPADDINDTYGQVTWALFYAEHLGMHMWADTWSAIGEDPHLPMAGAMTRSLWETSGYSKNEQFATLLARNHLWHALSGSRQILGYGFPDAAVYPDGFMEQRHDPMPDLYEDTHQLPALSGINRIFHVVPGRVGAISLEATHDHDHLAFGITGYMRDGSAAEWVIPADAGGQTSGATRFSVSELDSFVVVVANAAHEDSLSYTLKLSVQSVPEVATLKHNFPNPVSTSQGPPHTTIVFTVPESEKVAIDLYDLLGRRVRQLFNDEVGGGRHEVPVDAGGLSSGIYIYRLRTAHVQESGKMTLIR